MLRRVLSLVALCSSVAPVQALAWAWENPAEQVAQTAGSLDPRTYLYTAAPDLAPRLDCIIADESGWDPSRQNASSKAAGLAQFIPSTWQTTPQGKQGLSPFEPVANIDAAIWLARTRGWSQWQVVNDGLCP